MLNTFIIKHSDNKTDVSTKIELINDVHCFVYELNGKQHSREVTMEEAISLDIIECPCTDVLPHMGFDNVVIGETCMGCGKLKYF